jgi:hypothetical protein
VAFALSEWPDGDGTRHRRAICVRCKATGCLLTPCQGRIRGEEMPRAKRKRRHRPHLVHRLILSVQCRRRQLLPTSTAPAFKPMQPDPPHDPTVKLMEELSDAGSGRIIHGGALRPSGRISDRCPRRRSIGRYSRKLGLAAAVVTFLASHSIGTAR